MNRDHQIDKRTTGLYGKFSVRRNDGTDAPGQKAGDATPPATPQPETPERCQLCGGTVQAHLALDAPCRMFVGGIRRLSLSPPPDVERLTREQIRERVQTLPVTDMDGEDMVDLNDVLALFSLSSTPGEPR